MVSLLRPAHTLATLLALALAAPAAVPAGTPLPAAGRTETAVQGRVEQRAAQFRREADPVRKARAFPRYGEEMLALLRAQLRAERFPEAMETLQRYHSEAQIAFRGLKESGIDAERRPNGFRQLQIHLRQSLRHLDESARSAPLADRERYEAVRAQVAEMNNELIRLLFPRQPGKRL